MLNFIVNKTADAYFCNLIWYIGNHAVELEKCSVEEAEYVEILKIPCKRTGKIQQTDMYII